LLMSAEPFSGSGPGVPGIHFQQKHVSPTRKNE
jgi:hypothetical protein